MRPRAAGFRCRILDNGLFILNLSLNFAPELGFENCS